MSNVPEAILLLYFKRDLSSIRASYRRREVVVIEVYEDMESDAPDAPDASVAPNAPTATTGIEGKENEVGGRKRQTRRQIAVGNRSGNAGVLKAAGNKGKLETRQSAKDRPASITALKLIAKQGADEKAELEK